MANLQLVNIWLATTNLLVIPTLITTNSNMHFTISSMASIASFFMHISERKHGLNGIKPFAQFADLFLNCDRVMAIIGIIYMLSNYWRRIDLLLAGLLGLIFMTISESKNVKLHTFVIFHTLWHAIVYYILFLTRKL